MDAKIAVAALAALLLAAPVRAEEKPAPTARESIMTFFRNLKAALAESAVAGERKKNRTGSVAAVRGAGQYTGLADPNEPALKGDARSKREKAQIAEDAELEKAVDLVLKGKAEDGVKALEEFKAKHPKSHNLAKVQEALEQAKALGAAAAAEAAPAERAQAPAKSEASKAGASKAEPAKN